MATISKREGDKLTLDIDNGDLKKLDQVMTKWAFKDYQSFLRFAISTLLLSEEKSISIKMDGKTQDIVPASDLIKD